jgi:hypothetical protein
MHESDKYIDVLATGKSWSRFLQHARLHCLAKASDDEDEAYLEFVQVQYWHLMVAKASSSGKDLATKVRAMTERECDRIVIDFDRANSGGGAKYWESLPSGKTAPDEWLRSRYQEQAGLQGSPPEPNG